MNRLRAARPTTCIYLQIKRHAETYFVLCDEYDPVESLKGRVLNILEQTGFSLDRSEEPLTTEDIRLCLKKRVSTFSSEHNAMRRFRFLTNPSNLLHKLSNNLGSGQRCDLPRLIGV